MEFKKDFLAQYLVEAPVALANERVMECALMSRQRFIRPILDVGCGEGMFAHILFGEKIDLGIDPQPGELAKAREYGAYKELIECFGQQIPKASNSYQTAMSNSVLEHIPDLEPVLREVHRVLVPGGNFYVTVPTDRFEQHTWICVFLSGLGLKGLSGRFRRWFNGFWKHYHCYPVKQWQEMFERNGFQVAEAVTYGSRRICLFNDLFVLFALPSFVVKKALNRWFVFPALRKAYAPLLAEALSGFYKNDLWKSKDGGLAFFILKKA